MRDRALENSVADRMLKLVFPKLFDIGCFSHTIDHVGERFNTPELNDFMKTWIGVFFLGAQNLDLLGRQNRLETSILFPN